MSRLLAFSLCVFSLTPSLALADKIDATSTITAATVYSDRATITRQAVLDIPAGSHTISFAGLPTTLFPDSLRADGSAAASVKFGAVVYKQTMAAQLAAPRAQELQTALEALEDQRMLLNVEKRALTAKIGFLGNVGTQAGLRTNEEIAEINLKPEQWSGAAQSIYSGMLETMTADAQLDIKLRELDRQIQKAKADINAPNNNQYSSYDVSIPLESSSATRLTLDLSYQVPNASWRPIYDARLNTETSKLELIQYGSVRQTTGEDWSNVKLSLSTAQPQRGTSLPDLTPYWVNIFEPSLGGGNRNFNDVAQNITGSSLNKVRMSMNEAPAAAPMMAMSDQRAEQAVEFQTASIETGGFVSEYKIPGPASVVADGTETKLMVGNFTTESTPQVHIKPQLSTDAFLVSKSKLKGESPVLPGQVSLFRDGAYVGQSNIPLLRPDEEHVLFFGTDDQVSVKRKVLKDQKSDAGMIVRENIQERQFITEIQNLHTKPVQIVVKETLPTGRNEKIRTEILKEQTTAGYEEDSANIKGLLRWEFPLEPKAKKDVKLGWKVTWPKDTNLSGL